MKTSLILTPNELNENFTGLSVREDNIGHIPPLSLMQVASILENNGVEVQLIDMEAQRLTYENALSHLNRFSPDIIGFTLSTYSFHPILYWIRKFKKDTQLPVLVGGAHVGLYPEETMSHMDIDYALVGEAEIPLPQFIKAFSKGESVADIPSICSRKNGNLIVNTQKQFVKNVDDVPLPSRHLIDNSLYSNILTRRKNFTALLSTRGCPYRCAFCDQKTPPYRIRSAINIIDELRLCYDKYGVREVDIYDSTFTANKNRVMELCNLLNKKGGMDIGWTVRSRVDSVNKEMLDHLKMAGCHTIMYGIESSDPDILKRMRKGISPERVREIIQYTHDIGIDILGFFLFGFPGENRTTIERTIDFSLELPLDYVQYSVLVPFPDTEIYEYYRENGLSDYWSKYTVDEKSVPSIIDLIETELDRNQISEYVTTAYRRFFLRPRIVMRRLRSLRSIGEFFRLSSAAVGVIKSSLIKQHH